MNKQKIAFIFSIILILIIVFGLSFLNLVGTEKFSQIALVGSNFIYSFNSIGTLHESGNMAESSSPYWWLNSGGILDIKDGIGSTNHGRLASVSKWRLLYRISSPTDTDNGFRPQNIFRLISRNVWHNFSEQVYFKITSDNLSSSPNRNISNGLLLFLRYQDQNNTYYAGLRVDGTAVIKKKVEGEYTTLAQEKVFEGNYNRDRTPSLLPKDEWIGIKSEIRNEDGKVRIKLYIEESLRDSIENNVTNNKWKLILEATDEGDSLGKKPILESGFVGIRSDFMDVQFKDFRVSEI
jgi:hypothetical protein